MKGRDRAAAHGRAAGEQTQTCESQMGRASSWEITLLQLLTVIRQVVIVPMLMSMLISNWSVFELT